MVEVDAGPAAERVEAIARPGETHPRVTVRRSPDDSRNANNRRAAAMQSEAPFTSQGRREPGKRNRLYGTNQASSIRRVDPRICTRPVFPSWKRQRPAGWRRALTLPAQKIPEGCGTVWRGLSYPGRDPLLFFGPPAGKGGDNRPPQEGGARRQRLARPLKSALPAATPRKSACLHPGPSTLGFQAELVRQGRDRPASPA